MEAYIYDALRTPRGKARADGGLAKVSPHELVRQLVDALGARGTDTRAADALILGCVGQTGAQGGNIALISKLHAGLKDEAAAYALNNYCVSGLTAVGQAAACVANGTFTAALAGGVECMSRVGFMADKADYYGDASFPSRTRYIPVALAADRLAMTENVSRAELDAAALRSNERAAAAEADPRLTRSRIVVTDGQGATLLAADECVRPQTTLENLAGLKPAFAPVAEAYQAALDGEVIDFRHTIAHAPPMCDAAALALVAGKGAVAAEPRARIVSFAEAGGDPRASLLAGFSAMKQALVRARLTLREMDRVEFMEAFGVTIVKFLRDCDVDPDKVNVAGGHIARGHPLGASGAILLSSLLDDLDAADGQFGLVVTTGASGIGAAMVVERLSRAS